VKWCEKKALGNLGKVGCQEEIGGKAHGNFPLLRSLCEIESSRSEFSSFKDRQN
jgi:hypothetical protein